MFPLLKGSSSSFLLLKVPWSLAIQSKDVFYMLNENHTIMFAFFVRVQDNTVMSGELEGRRGC